jgi:DNA-binding MarR family transcriptional regulator
LTVSLSKLSKRRRADARAYVAPPTVSAPNLLRAGSDRTFQKLVFDLFTITARLEEVRLHLASRMGVSGPQYSILRALAALQGQEGISIGTVAEYLQVTNAFITAQSTALAQQGFLDKKADVTDRRVSRLSLTHKGERFVDDVIEQVRPINDRFFGTLDRTEFDALSTIIDKLVRSSRDAIVHVSSENHEALLSARDRRGAFT